MCGGSADADRWRWRLRVHARVLCSSASPLCRAVFMCNVHFTWRPYPVRSLLSPNLELPTARVQLCIALLGNVDYSTNAARAAPRRHPDRPEHKCGAASSSAAVVEAWHAPKDGNEHHAGDGSWSSCSRLASSACASFFAMTEDSAAAVENRPPPRPHSRPHTGSNSFMCGDVRGLAVLMRCGAAVLFARLACKNRHPGCRPKLSDRA